MRHKLVLASWVVLTGVIGLWRAAFAQEAGLIGRWPFDEGTGTNTVDAAGNGNAGVLIGDPLPVWTSGVSSNALLFDGAQNEVVVPDAPTLSPSNALTITAWVKTATNLTSEIMAKWSTSTNAGSYLLSLTNGYPKLELMLGGAYTAVMGQTSLSSTNWHHVAGTYDGTTMTVYLDANPVGSVSATGMVDAVSDPIRFGLLAGQLDDVRLYNTTLTTTNLFEIWYADSDGDGYPDFWEADTGTDPNDLNSYPSGGVSNLNVNLSGPVLNPGNGVGFSSVSAGGCRITNTLASGVTPTECSSDGQTFSGTASAISPQSAYSTLGNTSWIGCGQDHNADWYYRATFVLLSGATNVTCRIQLYADNVATAFLNGTEVLAQDDCECAKNFQNPPAEVTVTNVSSFLVGTNYLVIKVYNYTGPAGLDYLATVSYDVAPPSLTFVDVQGFQPQWDGTNATLQTPITDTASVSYNRNGALTDGASLVVVQLSTNSFSYAGWTVSVADTTSGSTNDAAQLGSLWSGDANNLPPLPATLAQPGSTNLTLGADEMAIFYRLPPSWAFGKETKEQIPSLRSLRQPRYFQ